MQLQEPFAISPGNAAGFGYQSPISINSAQVPSTQTDFPVLVSQTDNRFKTVANGGHVQNSSGFDIRPYSDSAITTAITGYELEFYDPVNGIVDMWVKVGSLTSSSTPIYLAYGNPGLSTDGSSTSTWSNSFLGVYHLADGTTLNVNSATGSNNGTNHGVTATSGQIDGAGSFVSASSQYIDLGSGMNPNSVTLSALINATSFANSYNEVIGRFTAGTNFWLFTVKGSGKLACFVAVSGPTSISYDGTGTNTLSTATWYHVALTYNSVGANHLIGYVDGSVDKDVDAGTTDNSLNTGAAPTYVGNDAQGAGFFWNGVIDEARISSVARSADWIATESNNQLAPATFETLGAEVPL